MMGMSHQSAIIILTACFLFTSPAAPSAQTPGHVYSTWDNLEVDKCGSAWLIKRFVDTAAVFRLVPEGGPCPEGLSFDTPESKIRRTFNKTAFDGVIAHFDISDPAVARIADIIKDIELNLWGRKKYAFSAQFNAQIVKIIGDSPSPQEALPNTFGLFDDLLDQIRKFVSGMPSGRMPSEKRDEKKT